MEDNYETYDQLMGYKTVEHKDLPPVGGVLTPGRHAGEMSEGDLGIETALANRVNDLTKELEVVKASNDDWRERFGKEQNKIYEIRNNLGELLKTQIEHELITNTGAKEIAELVGVELTKTVNVSGTMSFSGQIEVSIFDDTDELSRYELDADLNVAYGYDALGNFDYDLDSVEFEDE
jgi:hypothetical protein